MTKTSFIVLCIAAAATITIYAIETSTFKYGALCMITFFIGVIMESVKNCYNDDENHDEGED